MPTRYNVLGGELIPCSLQPLTGFYRDGYCHSGADDEGLHIICTVMTDEFLSFSKTSGNDLSTPHPEFHFPGLKAGDCWCLCALRWVEAFKAGCAPQVILEASSESILEFVDKEDLIAHQHKA